MWRASGQGQSIYSFHQFFIWQGGGRGIVGQGMKRPLSTHVWWVCVRNTHQGRIKGLKYTQKWGRDVNRTAE